MIADTRFPRFGGASLSDFACLHDPDALPRKPQRSMIVLMLRIRARMIDSAKNNDSARVYP
jgi:hypothetical protein